jgi:copper chaperone CopZ
MQKITLRIENMHCGACVGRVTQALGKLDGVSVEEVRIGTARLQAPEGQPQTAILNALEKAGYKAVVEQ